MKKNQIVAGTIIGYLCVGVQSIATVLVTPFIIASLGDGTYGVYKIVSSLIAYLGILNFGFGNSTIKFLTEIRAGNEPQKEREFLSVIKMLNFATSFIAVLAGIVLYFCIPGVFATSLTGEEVQLAQRMFTVLIASVVINILNDIYVAIIAVHEKFIFTKSLDLAKYTLRIFLIFSILSLSPSAVTLTWIDLGLSLFTFLANVVYCRKSLHTFPRYSLKVFKGLDRAYYKVVLIYASYYFLDLIIGQLIWNTDSVIIGMRLSSVDAAIYGAGGTISAAFYSLSLVVGVIIFPRVVRLINGGASKTEWTDLMITVGRVQSYIALAIVCGYWAIGRQFVQLWLGDGYTLAWMTSLLVMVGTLVNSLATTGHLILRALSRQKFYLFTNLLVFLVNAAVTYIIVVRFGIVGAAAATMASYFIGACFFIMPYYYRVIGIEVPRFLKNMARPILVSAVIGLFFYLLYAQFDLSRWPALILAGLVFVAVYYGAMLLFVANKQEKDYLRSFISKLLRR